MGTYQIAVEFSLYYEENKLSLLRVISNLQYDVVVESKKKFPNKFKIAQTQSIINQVESFINLSDKEVNSLIEIIKKQALILEAAGIKYPTINQSLHHIQDIYFQSKGRTHELGSQDILPVQIPII